jgi:hypothetical protein
VMIEVETASAGAAAMVTVMVEVERRDGVMSPSPSPFYRRPHTLDSIVHRLKMPCVHSFLTCFIYFLRGFIDFIRPEYALSHRAHVHMPSRLDYGAFMSESAERRDVIEWRVCTDHCGLCALPLDTAHCVECGLKLRYPVWLCARASCSWAHARFAAILCTW